MACWAVTKITGILPQSLTTKATKVHEGTVMDRGPSNMEDYPALGGLAGVCSAVNLK